ncbi:uncharacterized protein LOC129751921 [Uranotaenia lowii]|uniref:uncharacterized protein LOC129751921 n=1 Tax=Uranotaenia lowii TaxID=190385 RepID=UPI0024796B61|nr:uncharacterized protein LOC129751921 [Uranotaenia lowii]
MDQQLSLEQLSLKELNIDSKGLHINQFPNEILDQIFTFLNLVDRKSVSRVCLRWSKLAFAPHFMQGVVLRPNGRVANRYFEKVIKQSERVYKNIDGTELLFLDYLLYLGPNLESFRYRSRNKDDLRKILRFSPNLKELRFDSCAYQIETEPMPVMKQLVNFTTMDTNLLMLEIEQMFPKLSKMSVRIYDHNGNTRMCEALRHFGPQLDSLRIEVSKNSAASIYQMRFPQLEKIFLSGYVVTINLKGFFSHLANLVEIYIGVPIFDGILEEITKTCKKLQVLSFDVSGLRGSGLASLEQLPQLKSLEIFGDSFNTNVLTQCSKPIDTVLNLDIKDLRLYREKDFISEFLSKIFPNTTNFVLRCDYSCKSLMIPHFPKMQELTITSQFYLDILNKLPGISTLKTLRILDTWNSPKQILADVILSLLRRMPALRFVELNEDLRFRMSKDLVCLIRQEFPQCVIQWTKTPHYFFNKF